MPLRTNAEEQRLLLGQLEALNADQVREFLVRHEVEGSAAVKAEVLVAAETALRARGRPTWEDLVLYLDEVEPYGRQHVYPFKRKQELKRWGNRDYVERQLAQAGLGDLLGTQTALAAPNQVQLSSINLDEERGVLDIQAISQRSYLRRRQELDDEVDPGDLPGQNTVAMIYEQVSVRSWVRLHCETGNGGCSIHVSQLERKADYEAVVEEFTALIGPWFPVDQLEPLDLAKAIDSLQEDYESNRDNAEVRVQGAQYDSRGGRHSAVSSARARQGVLGESTELDQAVTAMRLSGPAANGNFYFHQTDGGSPDNPIQKDLHVKCVVNDNRINFLRPTVPDELNWVLKRIRYHAQ